MQTCKIILATSLIWFLIDVVLLFYYTDCRGAGCGNGGGDGSSKGPSADPLVQSDDNQINIRGGNEDSDSDFDAVRFLKNNQAFCYSQVKNILGHKLK